MNLYGKLREDICEVSNGEPIEAIRKNSTRCCAPLHPSLMRTTDEPVIEVKHLAKRYRNGLDRTYTTFSESAVNVLKSPVKSLKRLRQRTDTFWALKDINFEVQREREALAHHAFYIP